MKPKLYPLAGGCVLIWITILASALSAWAASGDQPGWNESVLYSFQGPPDGSVPAGGVIFGKDGNLYGATYGGGNGVGGTVFQLRPPAEKGGSWTETVLHSFQGRPTDGDIANGGLVSDAEGNLYGVAAYGGSGNCVPLGGDVGCGIVYKMTPPALSGGAWTESVIYSFQGGKDGYVPWGDLTLDAKGNLYGATEFGGGKGNTCDPYYQYCGTVFKLSPPKVKGGKWTEKVLHSFAGGNDGANPNGGLILDGNGMLYGTTFYGGNQGCKENNEGTGCGTVFQLKPPTNKAGAWSERVLHRFIDGADGADGAGPNGGLLFDLHGALCGTAVGGGKGYGMVFCLAPPAKLSRTWKETLVHAFTGADGAEPAAGLAYDSAGNLEGTTCCDGRPGGGTIFQLKHSRGSGWIFVLLHSFTGNPDGVYPSAALTLGKSGGLYGTTQYGGTSQGGQNCGSYGCGTVFEIKP